MSASPAPRFSKNNQHFVPRFWIKRFAGSDGRILGRRRGETRALQVAAGDIMTGDWTYTLLDGWWRPADKLEDALSVFEGEAATVMAAVDDVSSTLSPLLKERLSEAIAISVCRLPWVMRRGHQRMKELAAAFASIVDCKDDRQFIQDIRNRFGVDLSEADCSSLRSRPDGDLEATARALNEISPQNPVFAEQQVLQGARPIAAILRKMDFTLLDAPAESLVLSDTPMPDSEVASGFLLPLSHRLMLSAQPAAGPSAIFGRRAATPAEVEASNRFQFDSLLDIVVGPDKDVLERL
jgi:Protein of unknown function (DUF4238)